MEIKTQNGLRNRILAGIYLLKVKNRNTITGIRYQLIMFITISENMSFKKYFCEDTLKNGLTVIKI